MNLRLLWLATLASLAPWIFGGCVERKLVVRSDPAGARVFIDGALRGEAPVEIPFVHYGTREVTVRAPGFTTRRVRVAIAPPCYQWPGLDLLTDVLWPGTIQDRRAVYVRLGQGPRTALEALAAGGAALDVEAGADAARESSDALAERARVALEALANSVDAEAPAPSSEGRER